VTEPMSHEDLSELVAVYALDALDDDEVRIVEEHLAVCPRCRAELAEHREVTALLAHTGAPAPEGVWDRIAASLEEPPPEVDLADVLPLTARPPRRPAGAPHQVETGRPLGRWAMIAAAAAVVALLGIQVARQDQQIDDLREQVARGPVTVPGDAGEGSVVDLTSADGAVRVQAVVDETGRGYLLAHGLPALRADQTYQLWGVVKGGGDPVSLGVLGRDPGTAVFHVSEAVEVLAITAEQAPGVVVSREDPVVAGELA
jgi:anti-sigma-K factor RskA